MLFRTIHLTLAANRAIHLSTFHKPKVASDFRKSSSAQAPESTMRLLTENVSIENQLETLRAAAQGLEEENTTLTASLDRLTHDRRRLSTEHTSLAVKCSAIDKVESPTEPQRTFAKIMDIKVCIRNVVALGRIRCGKVDG
ncbi:unnamed protein product [Protopolystoma xenopodis]|uniref:Uncharacterized protein n=1 Tax=Protopolystoma xenopodis TaxID=117903 RepID=A0A3S5A8E7_9PLAT|nr:unnamed protein product [Protopolystoma xenopodis]